MIKKNVVIIEPSSAGLGLLSAVSARGYNLIVFSANSDERVIPNYYKNIIHELIEVDTNNLTALKELIIKLHNNDPISAIIPGFEIYVAHAARLADCIGVPALSIETADALRDKNKMRICLRKAGVESPNHLMIYSSKDIKALSPFITFPAVIKPVDQSGSVHVSKVDDLVSLENAYQKMCDDKWTEMAKGVGSIALIEEYIDGPEFSVEGYVNNHLSHIVSVTEKITRGNPYFVEMGHIVSADISQSLHKKISLYIQRVINALQINLGVFHAEIRISHQGPVLMEIAGRLAGDRICDLIQLSSNTNLFQIMLDSYLGHAINFSSVNFKQYAGIRYFSANMLSRFSNVVGVDKIKCIQGFEEFKLLIQPGETVPPLENFMGRAAYCIFTAPTYDALQSRLCDAERCIQFL